jgi:hypothetical protein
MVRRMGRCVARLPQAVATNLPAVAGGYVGDIYGSNLRRVRLEAGLLVPSTAPCG